MKLFFILATLLLLTSCADNKPPVLFEKTIQSKQAQFKVQFIWESGPTAQSFSSVKILFYDKKGLPLNDIKDITFIPFMPSHGHGTSIEDQVITTGHSQNEFIVTNVFFVMGGSWVITLTAKTAGISDSAEVSVDVP